MTTALPYYVIEALKPALDAGYTADIELGPEIMGIGLQHASLPPITMWGSESVDVIMKGDVRDFKGPTAIVDAVTFAQGAQS